ncbi:MAG: hypothetical protein QM778_28795 [Myxococcales bacterium]
MRKENAAQDWCATGTNAALHQGKEGDRCTDDEQCAAPLYCNFDEWTPKQELGDACEYPWECDDGLACNFESAGEDELGVCEEVGSEGKPCTPDHFCDEGLTCRANVCTSGSGKPLEAPCTMDYECESARCELRGGAAVAVCLPALSEYCELSRGYCEYFAGGPLYPNTCGGLLSDCTPSQSCQPLSFNSSTWVCRDACAGNGACPNNGTCSAGYCIPHPQWELVRDAPEEHVCVSNENCASGVCDDNLCGG